jgi:hypothetical protein
VFVRAALTFAKDPPSLRRLAESVAGEHLVTPGEAIGPSQASW